MSSNSKELEHRIDASYESGEIDAEAVKEVIGRLHRGLLRTAEKGSGGWVVDVWVKKAILLYYRLLKTETIRVGPCHYRDKIPLRHDLESSGARIVPPAVASYGSFIAEDVIMMPSYVGIGAFVGRGTMIDTWATVGSCTQIGARVHISCGVVIGGVLEPLEAQPVIVEDECFIAPRCVLKQSLLVGEQAVLGANLVLSGSTPILDVTSPQPVEYLGVVPARAVVAVGSRTRRFPAGNFEVTTGLIVGWRNEAMDREVSLEDALRDHGSVR